MCGSLRDRLQTDLLPIMRARAEARKAARKDTQAQRAGGGFGSAVEILLNRARVAQVNQPTAPTAPSTMLSPLGGNTLG